MTLRLFKTEKPLSKALSIVMMLVFAVSTSMAQSQPDKVIDSVAHLPSEEVFEKSDELVVPWRRLRCSQTEYQGYNEPNCPKIEMEYTQLHQLSIYNRDGSIWYQFSLLPEVPNSIFKKQNPDFMPFRGDIALNRLSDYLFLRLVGESGNWYEVEVNEKTGATKFVPKNTKMWKKASWKFWIFFGRGFVFDATRVKLRNKPKGDIIPAFEEKLQTISEPWRVRATVLEVEGEWAYIEVGRSYKGWIRWKNGKDILVGNAYNYNQVPEITSDEVF